MFRRFTPFLSALILMMGAGSRIAQAEPTTEVGFLYCVVNSSDGTSVHCATESSNPDTTLPTTPEFGDLLSCATAINIALERGFSLVGLTTVPVGPAGVTTVPSILCPEREFEASASGFLRVLLFPIIKVDQLDPPPRLEE